MSLLTPPAAAYRRPPMLSLREGLCHRGPVHEAAVAELHALLLRGAHHELRRRRDLLLVFRKTTVKSR